MKNPNAHLFNFCPACGEQKIVASDKKSFQCTECRFKFYLNCAAAAIALIFSPDNKLLVTRRKYEPAKGMLDFPGGFADPGESIENCLIREVKEELNLDIRSQTYALSLPNTYKFKKVTYAITDFVFICQVENFDKIQAADDIDDFEFLNPSQLDINLFGLDSSKKIIGLLQTDDVLKLNLNPL